MKKNQTDEQLKADLKPYRKRNELYTMCTNMLNHEPIRQLLIDDALTEAQKKHDKLMQEIAVIKKDIGELERIKRGNTNGS